MYFATKPSWLRTTEATHAWKALITSRRSSGSTSEASAVESTSSQNITVTCRRSTCAAASLDGDEAGSGIDRALPNAAPQLAQNLFPKGFLAPHATQAADSDAPQSPQN